MVTIKRKKVKVTCQKPEINFSPKNSYKIISKGKKNQTFAIEVWFYF